MGSSQTHTEFEFDNDPRLAVALGALLEQSAERLGINEDTLRKLQSAARKAWQDCWRSLNNSGKLHMECDELDDRIELTFHCAGPEMEACVAELKMKVDHVTLEKSAPKPHLKITTYKK